MQPIQLQAGHWGFIEYRPPKKNRISTKYRPHSTLSTKYRPQKFLEKRAFTIFTFKSWDIHILGKWGLSWNMRDKWGLFQLRTFRKALYMDHTALCRVSYRQHTEIKLSMMQHDVSCVEVHLHVFKRLSPCLICCHLLLLDWDKSK